jgi:hypothetical protein
MFGLLTSTYNNYRINDSTANKEQFNKHSIGTYKSWPYRGTFNLIEILLTIFSILVLWDCYITKKWDTQTFALLLVLFFVPYIGDILALCIIIIWFIDVRPNSNFIKIPKLSI